MLTFKAKAKTKSTDLGKLRRFISECESYALVESPQAPRRERWKAIRITCPGEFVLSRHRTREQAEAACNAHREARKVAGK